MIDFNKKMRDDLSVIANPAGVGNITDSSLSNNLARFRKEIKSFREKNHIDYKLPVGEDTSPRALLSNAFETVVTNPIEKQKLQEYTITVSVAEGTNHKAPADKTYTVTTEGYLVYNGVPCYSVIGVGKPPQSGFPAAESVVTRQNDGYYYVATSDANWGIAYLDTKVDLTNYSKLSIWGTFSQDEDIIRQHSYATNKIRDISRLLFLTVSDLPELFEVSFLHFFLAE